MVIASARDVQARSGRPSLGERVFRGVNAALDWPMPTHLRLHFETIRFFIFASTLERSERISLLHILGLMRILGPGTASGANCNFKATPAADSTSCKDDAVVTMAESDNILTVRRQGRAELTLASNPHDPVGDIEIVQLDCFLRGLAPTGKRRLVTAHTLSGHCGARDPT
jgi:hypothetical protein